MTRDEFEDRLCDLVWEYMKGNERFDDRCPLEIKSVATNAIESPTRYFIHLEIDEG